MNSWPLLSSLVLSNVGPAPTEIATPEAEITAPEPAEAEPAEAEPAEAEAEPAEPEAEPAEAEPAEPELAAPRPATPAPVAHEVPISAGPVLPPIHPLRVRWGITAPVIATTGLGFALMEGLGGTRPSPTVCTPPEAELCPTLGPLEPIDRIALGHYNHDAAIASDVMVALTLAGPIAASLAESILWARDRGTVDRRTQGAARFGIDVSIWTESIGVAMLTANVMKEAVGRPRPLTHLGEPALIAEGLEPDGDYGRSFPSGHATLAFSSAVAGSMLLTLRQCQPQPGRRCAPRTRRQRVALGLMWGLSLAAASTTATLRVVAGKHYPTDVLMGAALGTTSGMVIPLLHDRRAR